MKKRKCMAVLAAMSLMSMSVMFTGCGAKDTAGDDANMQTEAAEDGKTENDENKEAAVHTVTFYDSDGTTVLKTEEVEDGSVVADFVPEKDGYIFVGWFATPQMSHVFDFDTAITGDTDAFAGFVSYVEDTREYAIVGSGTSPVLLESSWGAVIGDAQKMEKQESDTENTYTITLDLNEGDEFQFAIDTSWSAQRGYGYLDTITLDGTDYFQNSGSLGEASTKRSNIKCSVAGNYTFTLTTYPGEDQYETDNANYTEENKEAFNINPYDKITWTYNGAGTSDAQDTVTDYYIKGAVITGWEDVYSDETKFTEENGIYTLHVTLTEGDEFMFTSMVTAGDTSSVGTEYIRYSNIAEDDSDSLAHVTEGGGSNLIASEAGDYVFEYDPAAKLLKVSVE